MLPIRVRTASRSYPVWAGHGALRLLPRGLRPARGEVFFIVSRRVWSRWGRELRARFKAIPRVSAVLLLDDSERRKTLETAEALSRRLVRAGADRNATLVAVGGGVVGDLVGFVASTFLRGVEYGQVATTLLAQIDSAIGGKTGVNLPEGKNLVGTFYQPAWVVADSRFLRSLPQREFRAGLFELIKYAVIADARLFVFLEENLERLLELDAATLDRAICRAIAIKADVVHRDEREQDLRRILNFGHTIGHALETLAGYGRLRHGEAVGLGMLAATRLAVREGLLGEQNAARIERLILRVGKLPSVRGIRPEAIYAQLFVDKKHRGEKLHFVLPVRIGRVKIVSDIARGSVVAACRSILADWR